MSSSVKTMSWSDTPGRTFTLNTLFGRFVRIKSRVLSFLLVLPQSVLDRCCQLMISEKLWCIPVYTTLAFIDFAFQSHQGKLIKIKIKEVSTRGGGGTLIFSSYVGSGPASTVYPPPPPPPKKKIRNFKHPKNI